MGIEVIWDDEAKTVIRYILDGAWTWGDLKDAVATSNGMVEEVDYLVHFIYDSRTSAGVPPNALYSLRGLIGKGHKRTGYSVIVTHSKGGMLMLAKNLVQLTERLYRPRWAMGFTTTLEEAREMFAAQA